MKCIRLTAFFDHCAELHTECTSKPIFSIVAEANDDNGHCLENIRYNGNDMRTLAACVCVSVCVNTQYRLVTNSL